MAGSCALLKALSSTLATNMEKVTAKKEGVRVLDTVGVEDMVAERLAALLEEPVEEAEPETEPSTLLVAVLPMELLRRMEEGLMMPEAVPEALTVVRASVEVGDTLTLPEPVIAASVPEMEGDTLGLPEELPQELAEPLTERVSERLPLLQELPVRLLL